ncbi:MAG TPA: MerR family transcriptional regulator [Gaiellaceae bacterium]|nr:MerR family transcriptional regulator [Gaiellaceae bacterium]
MRIGEAARRAGVNPETIRYYERRGLPPDHERTVGGQREYSDDTVRFVSAVKEAQSLGFSLREIDDVVRDARRNPDGAAAVIRRRLETKLADVGAEIADLHRTRAGLERALDEVWTSVPHGTSPPAYLVRGGRHPQLAAGEALHVTNGESVASTLRRTTLGGAVLAWQDALHEGPLACVPEPEFRELRAGFLAECGWESAKAIAEEMRRRDELLAYALEGAHAIVLWFEHDLYDQLQLVQILAAVPAHAPGSVELIQSAEHLGPLDEEQLAALWPSRVAIAPATVELGHRAWHAVCSGEVETVLAEDTSALPHLAPALRRLLEEREPLGRTDRQLLEQLVAGPATPLQLFFANQAREEAAFLGDTWCFLHLHELAERGLVEPVAGGSLPLPPPRSDREAFTALHLRLTPAGRALV